MRTAVPKKQVLWRHEWRLQGDTRWSSSAHLFSYEQARRLALDALARSPGSRARLRQAEVRWSATAPEVFTEERLRAAVAKLPDIDRAPGSDEQGTT